MSNPGVDGICGGIGPHNVGTSLARDGHEITVVTRALHLDALHARRAVVVREADGVEWIAPVTAPDARV